MEPDVNEKDPEDAPPAYEELSNPSQKESQPEPEPEPEPPSYLSVVLSTSPPLEP